MSDATTLLPWDAGTWTHPPVDALVPGDDPGALEVTAAQGSDAWRITSYGFIHDSAHALVTPLPAGQAMEVEFTANYAQQFDQAGLMLRAGEDEWIKTGVEYCDGAPQLGAVVTHGTSDWSTAPVPAWQGQRVTVRASRSGDALTIRARAGQGPWQLVRVAYLDPAAVADAGPYVCAPSRPGLTVRFHAWRRTPADATLH